MQNPITSTSARVDLTRLSRRSPSSVRGLCRPGVSTRISCASGRCTMPRITRRVVCGRSLVIATLAPTKAFVSVDLPTFGRPARQANPERKAGTDGGWLTRQFSRMSRGREPRHVRPQIKGTAGSGATVVRVTEPWVDTDGQEALERSVITGYRWWAARD